MENKYTSSLCSSLRGTLRPYGELKATGELGATPPDQSTTVTRTGVRDVHDDGTWPSTAEAQLMLLILCNSSRHVKWNTILMLMEYIDIKLNRRR